VTGDDFPGRCSAGVFGGRGLSEGNRSMTTQIEQIEAALGIALASGSNPTAYVVEQVEDGWRIYDDWTNETFSKFADALAYARKCAADAGQAP